MKAIASSLLAALALSLSSFALAADTAATPAADTATTKPAPQAKDSCPLSWTAEKCAAAKAAEAACQSVAMGKDRQACIKSKLDAAKK